MNNRIEQLLEHIRVNEQIERLAKQAGCTIDRLGYGEGDLEEFAKLIVWECFTKLTPYMDDQSIDDIESELKEHFGVKE